MLWEKDCTVDQHKVAVAIEFVLFEMRLLGQRGLDFGCGWALIKFRLRQGPELDFGNFVHVSLVLLGLDWWRSDWWLLCEWIEFRISLRKLLLWETAWVAFSVSESYCYEKRPGLRWTFIWIKFRKRCKGFVVGLNSVKDESLGLNSIEWTKFLGWIPLSRIEGLKDWTPLAFCVRSV